MRARSWLAAIATAAVWALPLAAQEPPVPRRLQPKAFPVSFSANAGLSFGGTRATAADTLRCPTTTCVSAGSGSGWRVGVEVQAPLSTTLGVALTGEVGRPSQKRCFASQCESPTDLWLMRGTALLLWRFKARAPIYVGVGGAVARFDPAPVVGQKVTAEGQGKTTEFGGAAVVGYDFRAKERIGGRIAWRSCLMMPSSDGLPGDYAASTVAWDNSLDFGVRFLFGS
jgi:hypothetical protein